MYLVWLNYFLHNPYFILRLYFTEYHERWCWWVVNNANGIHAIYIHVWLRVFTITDNDIFISILKSQKVNNSSCNLRLTKPAILAAMVSPWIDCNTERYLATIAFSDGLDFSKQPPKRGLLSQWPPFFMTSVIPQLQRKLVKVEF